MAHAYKTLAHRRPTRVRPRAGRPQQGPDRESPRSSARVVKCRGKRELVASPHLKRVLPPAVARDHTLLRGRDLRDRPVGPDQQVDVVGKTGTTTDERRRLVRRLDAADHDRRLESGSQLSWCRCSPQFNGGPVTGGTFPAEIWRAYMESARRSTPRNTRPFQTGHQHEYRDKRHRHQLHLHVRAEHRDDTDDDATDGDDAADDARDDAADGPGARRPRRRPRPRHRRQPRPRRRPHADARPTQPAPRRAAPAPGNQTGRRSGI